MRPARLVQGVPCTITRVEGAADSIGRVSSNVMVVYARGAGELRVSWRCLAADQPPVGSKLTVTISESDGTDPR